MSTGLTDLPNYAMEDLIPLLSLLARAVALELGASMLRQTSHALGRSQVFTLVALINEARFLNTVTVHGDRDLILGAHDHLLVTHMVAYQTVSADRFATPAAGAGEVDLTGWIRDPMTHNP